MNSKELNLKLINYIPEIKDLYKEETSWQDGDNTGSHIIYADVFVPFIKEMIIAENIQQIIKAFDYIEILLNLDDEYVNEVIALSVLETLVFDNDIQSASFLKYAGTKTLELFKQIIKSI